MLRRWRRRSARLAAAASEGAGAAAAYLSTGHRDNPATGCPLSAIGSELARSDEKTLAGGDGRLSEACRDHGWAVSQGSARQGEAAGVSRSIDDDWRGDHVAHRDRPEIVGGHTQRGREERDPWLTCVMQSFNNSDFDFGERVGGKDMADLKHTKLWLSRRASDTSRESRRCLMSVGPPSKRKWRISPIYSYLRDTRKNRPLF